MAELKLDDLEQVSVLPPPSEKTVDQAAVVEIVPVSARPLSETKADRMRAMEDELLRESVSILADTMRFPQVDPNVFTIKQEWIDELGYEKAVERDRIARYGLMSAKDAPVGIKVAQAIASSIIKARSVEKAAPRSLNIVAVQMTAPPPVFRELEIEDDAR